MLLRSIPFFHARGAKMAAQTPNKKMEET